MDSSSGDGVVEGHAGETDVLFVLLDVLHGLLIVLVGLQVRILLGDGDELRADFLEGLLIGVDLFHGRVRGGGNLTLGDDFFQGLCLVGGIFAGELDERLEGVVTADLLDVDLLEGVVAQFVGLHELVLDGDAPEDEEGRDDQDDD